MKNLHLRGLLSAICVASVLAGFTNINAGPVRFDQVVQIMSAKPGKAETGSFSRLRVAGDYTFLVAGDDDDDDKKKKESQPQDGRVITTQTTDIVTDEVCECDEPGGEKRRGFPKWALLGLAAIPIAFILIKRKKDTPTPTQTPPPSMTPTMTPPASMTPTPHVTPTPTPPEPVPEPMTILLFGTGLASIGLAARRRFGKKGQSADEKEEK